VKRKALLQIVKAYQQGVSEATPLYRLYAEYQRLQPGSALAFADNEAVKIVAEEKIKYATVVEVMDVARGIRTPEGNVTMFPNVAIAGGIIQ
jgi:biopolymer transport protein ExbD